MNKDKHTIKVPMVNRHGVEESMYVQFTVPSQEECKRIIKEEFALDVSKSRSAIFRRLLSYALTGEDPDAVEEFGYRAMGGTFSPLNAEGIKLDGVYWSIPDLRERLK